MSQKPDILRIGSKTEPKIIAFQNDSKVVIEGESRVQNASDYFSPIYQQIARFTIKHNKVILHYKLKHINTLTIKHLVYLFSVLEELYAEGVEVKIIWEVITGDKEDYELAKDILHGVLIPYEIY